MTDEHLEKKIKTLRDTLTWMDLVMSSLNEGIVVLDNEWRVVFANSYLAEILGQNRILLLGKKIWEILPFLKPPANKNNSLLSIKSVSKLDGVYDFSMQKLNLKLLLRGKYVDHLKQAVCIISNVSVELKAEDALMSLHKEIALLKAQLKDKNA